MSIAILERAMLMTNDPLAADELAQSKASSEKSPSLKVKRKPSKSKAAPN